jgi:fructose-bisphosphate aldolase class 1
MYHELKNEFLQHLLRQMFETSWYVEKLTVKMVLLEDGNNEHQNALDYLSNSVTWCMKDSAVSVGLTEDKINY